MLTLALSGAAAPFWHQAQVASTTTTLEATDLDVIEALARDIQKSAWPQPPRSLLAVQVESSPGRPKSGMFGSATLMRNATTSQSVLHFRERNHASFIMDKRLKRGAITVMGDWEFRRLCEENRLEREGLGSAGVIYMWLPGYDRRRAEAVVYYFEVYGEVEGRGVVARLRREGKAWRVVERRQEWIT